MSTTDFQQVLSRNGTKVAHAREQFIDKDAPVPEILDGTVNVLWLTVHERKGLLKGPQADIYVDQVLAFRGASIRAFMAWSTKANKHFQSNPLSRKVTFPQGKVTARGIAAVLKATVTNRAMGGEILGSIHIGDDFVYMVELYAAGNILGLTDRVLHVFAHLQNLISANLLTYDQVTAVVNLLEPADALFQHLASDLARRRYQGRIPDPVQFEQYLSQHKNLNNAMTQVDLQHQAGREAVQRAVQKAKMNEEDRAHEAEQKRLNAEYRKRVSALQDKINAAKGSIISLSAEDAELKRELGI